MFLPAFLSSPRRVAAFGLWMCLAALWGSMAMAQVASPNTPPTALPLGKGNVKGAVVKVAWIDPLSGLLASTGQQQLKSLRLAAEHINRSNPAGVKFEIISIDNKLSVAESLKALQLAADQGARYIVQGQGSGVALALVEAVNQHNARHPGREIVYLNYGALDPDLTNSQCSFWHFRLEPDIAMKMEALTSFIKDQADVRKVYLINQNYPQGRQVSQYAKAMLARKRADIQVVGDDFHPLAQVRDFSPYVVKIKASGADAIITGNWGSDLGLLLKAAQDEGLSADFYTYYASSIGAPAAWGKATAGRVFQVADTHEGSLQGGAAQSGAAFHTLTMLAAGMARAQSLDAAKVAAAMEGLRFNSFNGEVVMRKTDHQLQQPLVIAQWQRVDGQKPLDVQATGMMLAPVKALEPYVASTPTSCQMARP